MNRTAWRAALTTVSLAAVATTGWSLYAVARHYDAPTGIAGAAVAVFDGAAYACLHLASEASEAGRSAIGARMSAIAAAGTSVYLNKFHADLIHGGIAATLLFSVPTLALLAVSELSWAGPRAAARTARGEHPYRLPAFGGWAWMLAPLRAGRTVKDRAVHHIEHTGRTVSGQSDTDRSATAVLGRRFAEMDPAEVIRIAHESQPELTPSELASLLGVYGVHVDAVQVALILHGRPTEYTVDRVRTVPDAEPEEPWESDPQIALIRADMLSGQRPDTIGETVRALLQKGLKDRAAAVAITREVLGPDTSPDSVRRTFDREIKKPTKPVTGEVGQGGEGYN
ncbi:hypothetical protein ACFYM2_21220 [Streptomyces sp. NPDC006711]|uniref:hypothetical protein n=1 Tax=Streptomyces sp. NPDC006711 TaxID=3364762 RepID=UPI0036747DF3